MLKIITATTIAFALMLSVMPYSVQAETAEQNQTVNHEVELKCENTGSYGQNTTCVSTDKFKTEQRQRILGTLSKRGLVAHKSVNTALDTSTTLMAGAVILAGTAAAVAKFKNKA